MKCSTCQNYINTPIECNLCKEKFCSEKCIFTHNQLYHQPAIDQSQDLSVNNNSFLNYVRETPNSESPFLVKGVMNYSYIIYEPIFAPENFTVLTSNGVPKSIGNGSFGNVYLAINNINKKCYAIKHMEKDKLFKYLTCLDPIYAEIDIQSRINHPNIVKLLFVRETQITFDLVMEYAQYGTLFDFVVKNKGLPEKIAFKFFIQVVNAIKFLHDNDVIHRDIKPENILLFENDVAKLCDFGWSIKCTDRLPGGSFRGTTEYMAPELINDMDYGKEIDMWMLGILLYELMHGFSPFRPKKQKFEEKEVVENIMSHNISFYMPVSDDCKELIYSLLESDLHKRCTIDGVYNSKFVKNFEKEEFETSSFDKEESENIDKSISNNVLNISNQQDNYNTMQIAKSQMANRYNDNEAFEPNTMATKKQNVSDMNNANDMSDIGFVPIKTNQNSKVSNMKKFENDNLPKKKLSSNEILNTKKELLGYSLLDEDKYENEPNAPKNNRRNRNKQNIHSSIAKLNSKKNDNILSPIKKIEEGSPKNTINNSPKNNIKNKKRNNNLDLSLNPNTILNNNLYTSRRYYRQKESLEISHDNNTVKKEALKTEEDKTEKRPKKEIANYIFNNNKEIDKKQKLSKKTKTSLKSNNQILSLSLSPGMGNYNPLLARSISPNKQFVFQKDKSDLMNQNNKFLPLDVSESKANMSQNLKDFPFDHLSSNSSLDIRKPVFITKIQKNVINKEKIQEKIVTKEKEPNDNMRRKNKKEKKETPQDNYNKNNINKNIKPNDNCKKGGSFVNNINSNIISNNNDNKIDEYLVNINTNNSVSLTNEIQKIKDNINTIIKNSSLRNFSVSAIDDIRLKRKDSDDSTENPFKSNDNKTKEKEKDKDKGMDKEKRTNPFSSNNLTTVSTPSNKEKINNAERHLSLKNTSLKNNSFVWKNKKNQILSGTSNIDSNKKRKQKLVYTDKREKKGKSVNKQMKDFRDFKFNKNGKQKKEMKLVKVNKNITNEIKEDIENNKDNENETSNLNKSIKKIENNENKEIENNQIKEVKESENKEINENKENKENEKEEIKENKENKDNEKEDIKNIEIENKEVKDDENIDNKKVENKEMVDIEIKEKEDNKNEEIKLNGNKENKASEKKESEKEENKNCEMTENIDNENKDNKNDEGEKIFDNNEMSENKEVDEVKIEEKKEIKITENKEIENKENEVKQNDDFSEKKEEKENMEKKENINTEKEKEKDNEKEIVEENKENKIEKEVMNIKKEDEEQKMNNEEENKEKKTEIINNINEIKENEINKDKETEEYTKNSQILNEENSQNKTILKEEINKNNIKSNSNDLTYNDKNKDENKNKDKEPVSNKKNSPSSNNRNTEHKSDKQENENKSNRKTIPKNNKTKKNEVKNNNNGIKKKDVKANKKMVINKNNNINNESSQKVVLKQNVENNKNEEKKEVKKIAKKNVVIKTIEVEKEDNNKEPKDKLKKILKTQQRKYSKEKRYTKVKIDPKKEKTLGQTVKISTNPNLKNRLQNKVLPKSSQAIDQLTNSSIQEYTIHLNNDETRNNNSFSKKINGSNSETKNTSYSKSHISNIKEKIKSFSIMSPEDINKMNKSRSPYYRKPFQFKNKLERKEFLFQEEDYDYSEIKQIKLVKKNIENKNIRDRLKSNTDKYLNQLKDKIEIESSNNNINENIEEENNKINEKNENKENIEINKKVINDRSIESNKERRPILNLKNKSGIVKQKKKYRKIKSDEIKDENEQNEKFNNDSESLIIDGDSEYGDSEIL